MVTSAMKFKKTLTPWKESYDQPRQQLKMTSLAEAILKKAKNGRLPDSQAYRKATIIMLQVNKPVKQNSQGQIDI